MGMDARIIAVGPYGAFRATRTWTFFDGFTYIEEGTMVAVMVAECNTSGSSRDMAEATGVNLSNPTSFEIKAVPGLDNPFEYEDDWFGYDKALDVLKQLSKLLQHGVRLFFDPNW